jgi:hypothetical protein
MFNFPRIHQLKFNRIPADPWIHLDPCGSIWIRIRNPVGDGGNALEEAKGRMKETEEKERR